MGWSAGRACFDAPWWGISGAQVFCASAVVSVTQPRQLHTASNRTGNRLRCRAYGLRLYGIRLITTAYTPATTYDAPADCAIDIAATIAGTTITPGNIPA